MKKRKLLLIILSIIFVLATVVILIPKKGTYADFGDFSGISDYGTTDDDGIDILFVALEILTLFLDEPDIAVTVYNNPQIAIPIIHLFLVIICIIKIIKRCEKGKRAKYIVMSIFIPLLIIMILPTILPKKYTSASDYIKQRSNPPQNNPQNGENDKIKSNDLQNEEKKR